MSRESVYLVILSLLCVASSDPVLRMCNRCDCAYKDGLIRIDCNNQQFTEAHLRQLQNNRNTSFIRLNFSNNNFSKVPTGLNTHGIQYLDLSMNRIEELDNLNNFEELLEVNLAYNLIKDFKSEMINLPFVISLNMSHCLLSDLRGFENTTLNELTTLDLSNNNIEVFNEKFMRNMNKLNYLDISFNLIKKLQVSQLKSLQILNVEGNLIGPKFTFPSTLLELNAQNNSISEILMDKETNDTSSSLVFLYLNQNKIKTLHNISFPSLRILDLSQNELETVSETLNVDNCPILEILILSQNEFTNFKFNAKLRLLNLKINEIKSIRKLKKEMFSLLENFPNKCIHISIKNNPELHTIEDSTFEHLDICFLDLGNNNLNYLPKIQTRSGDWKTVEYGINYQQNPVICDCNSQWILDEYVNYYYEKKMFQKLLKDLKCADPYYIRDYRLVHWYNWNKPIFCQDEETVIEMMTKSTPGMSFGEIFVRSSGTMLIVLIICTAFLATLFVIGLVIAKRTASKKSRWNRRF